MPVFGGWLRVRPTFHVPAIFAKQAANLDRISNGRLELNVMSSWWSDEARRYGVHFENHDDRYGRTEFEPGFGLHDLTLRLMPNRRPCLREQLCRAQARA